MTRTWRIGVTTSNPTDAGSGGGAGGAGATTPPAGTAKAGEGAAAAGEGTQTAEQKAAADAAAQATADAAAATAAAAAAAKAGEGEKPGGKAGDQAAPKVPDKYTLTIADEQKPYVDAPTLKRFEETARTAGMTNEEAQAFLDDQVTFAKAQSTAWETETKAHPTYGGDKLDETKALAKRFIDRIRPDGHPMRESFLTFLARGGAGNNIDVVAAMADAGRLMSEDPGPGASRGGSGTKAQTAEQKAAKLYDAPSSVAANAATTGS